VIPRSSRARDWAIALGVAALIALELLAVGHDGPLVLNLMVLPMAGVGLAWRRTKPYVTVLVLGVADVAAAVWLTDITNLSTTLLPVILAFYAVGRYADDARPGLPLFIVLLIGVNAGRGSTTADDWVFPLVMAGSALLVGRALRTRALVAAELAERTERLAVEQDLRAAEAAHEERRRIARELHDVVAHTLSVMVVQAGGARRTLARDPERAHEALVTVEATGRAALGELRRLLGFVGETNATESAAAPLDPQPTTAGLGALARRAGAAGLPTAFAVEGEPDPARPLPAGAEVAVYRIAQEALTNALKHAGPGARATVALRWGPGALELEVRDDGGGTGDTPGAERLPSGGHGLLGMRERVALYGGALDAAPLPGSGFRVLARLPLQAAAAAEAIA